MKTTFIIPTLSRPTLSRAVASANKAGASCIIMGDTNHKGAGEMRRKAIERAETDWVSFLDDDDTVTTDYVERLEEEIAGHPEADLIHFREYFVETGELLPYWPNVTWGNVGISFSVKTEIAKNIGFKSEPYEDYEFIKRVEAAGYNIFFSKYITYRVRH